MTNDPKVDREERQLMRVVQASVALSVGAMSAFFFSVKQVNPTVRFEFSTLTVLGFAVAAVFSWMAWQVIAWAGRGRKSQLVWLSAFTTLLCLGTAAAFAYGMRNVSWERQKDFATGAALAVAVLVALGLVFWRLMRFFERASEPDQQANDTPVDPR